MARLLKKGDQSAEIKEVQTLLMEKGSLTDEEINGVFDNETFRASEKLALKKSPDEFVIRALPEWLEQCGISYVEKVSSASSRVTPSEDKLETLDRARDIATTRHAY